MSNVVVFGTGSLAEVVHHYLMHDSTHDVVAFTAHEQYIHQKDLCGLPVVPYENLARTHPPDRFQMYVAVGYKNVNEVRAGIFRDVKSRGYTCVSYVSPRCTRIGKFPIGENCFIFEDNTLQPFTVIGDNVIMWSGNHIGHHSQIGDHCFISSHVVVSGHCRVGAYSFLGVNATLRDSISIGERCVIGAGALIMKSTGDREVYVERRTERFSKTSDQIEL
jgi:sugar O-acyltransferase (sialic acid O-acetyltransferase NeuD family)